MFDRERNRLIAVGETLHGPHWKRPLARDLGVTEKRGARVGERTARAARGSRTKASPMFVQKGTVIPRANHYKLGEITERAHIAMCARSPYTARTARAHATCICSITARTPNVSAANAPRAASINGRRWRAARARACPARPRLCRAA